MSAVLTVSTRRDGDGHVEMVAAGELDLSNIGRFENALTDALAESGAGAATTVNLSGVEYLDSAAFNLLFAHAERIDRIIVHPLLIRGLMISGLDQVVTLQSAG